MKYTYSIALTCNVELTLLQVRKYRSGEDLQEMVHVLCRREAVSWYWYPLIQIAEAYASRLVDKYDIGILAPSILVMYSTIAVLVDKTWAQLAHHPYH